MSNTNKKLCLEYLQGMRDPLEEANDTTQGVNMVEAMLNAAQLRQATMIEPQSVEEI